MQKHHNQLTLFSCQHQMTCEANLTQHVITRQDIQSIILGHNCNRAVIVLSESESYKKTMTE